MQFIITQFTCTNIYLEFNPALQITWLNPSFSFLNETVFSKNRDVAKFYLFSAWWSPSIRIFALCVLMQQDDPLPSKQTHSNNPIQFVISLDPCTSSSGESNAIKIKYLLNIDPPHAHIWVLNVWHSTTLDNSRCSGLVKKMTLI